MLDKKLTTIALKLVEKEIEKYESLLKQVQANIGTFPITLRSSRERKVYEVEIYLRNLKEMKNIHESSLAAQGELVGGY